MKRILFLILSTVLVLSMSGCGTLIRACTGLGNRQEASPEEPVLYSRRVDLHDANAVLGGISLTPAIDSMDSSVGYTYGEGYEYFVFKRDGAASISATVVPGGKDMPEGLPLPSLDKTQSVGGMEVRYGINRRRYEDYFSYKTQALITCGGDRVVLTYDYSSRSPECELIGLIEALFEAKE